MSASKTVTVGYRVALAFTLLTSGCGAVADGPGQGANLDAGADSVDNNDPGGPPSPLPDFKLVDVNATSPFSGQSVSPRQFLEKVSGWYFTHAS